jgi:hypothetical protein
VSVLSARQVEEFVERGLCVLEGAFSAGQAASARERVWARMAEKRGIRKDDPATWPRAYDIEEHLTHPDVLACFTDRLAAAVEELVGPGRWCGDRRWGLWPVNFSFGADQPYCIPSGGWHVDGNWFRHTLDQPRQGLLVVGLFSDIAPRGGGTIVAQGSHRQAARVLARYPEGLTHHQLFDEVLKEPIGDFRELTGAAGDVVLGHPLLFHTRGFNHGGPPRFISNTEASLKDPLQLHRADPADASVLERSIRAALDGPVTAPANGMLCRF